MWYHLIFVFDLFSFFSMAEYICIFFIYSFVDRYLGHFHVLAILNSTAMNIGAQASFRIRVFIFSRYVPRSGIAGSHGNSIFKMKTLLICGHILLTCSFLSVFWQDWVSLQALISHAPCSREPLLRLFPQPGMLQEGRVSVCFCFFLNP